MDPNFKHFRFFNTNSGDALYSYSLPAGNEASYAELIAFKTKQLAIEFEMPAGEIGCIEIKHDHELFKRIIPNQFTGNLEVIFTR